MRSDARLLLLDKEVVQGLLVPEDVTAAVREAFALHSRRQGRVFPVVRKALPTGGIFGIKSGDVSSQGLLGFKAAGFWPSNRGVGGEPHQATILLFDPATGRAVVQCRIDAGWNPPELRRRRHLRQARASTRCTRWRARRGR